MFGGIDFGSNAYNDLWKYCVVANRWIWIAGDTIINSPGSYGTLGVSSMTNTPPARSGSVGGVDHNGHLFLFGGQKVYSSGLYHFNDLWRFDIDTTCAPCSQTGLGALP